jgi:hypothetical protein
MVNTNTLKLLCSTNNTYSITFTYCYTAVALSDSVYYNMILSIISRRDLLYFLNIEQL